MTTTIELIEVPVRKLIEHSVNVRNGSGAGFDEKSIDELADSILANGLIQPIKVHGGDDGTYQVIAGHRRLRACQRLIERKDWKTNATVPCVLGEPHDDGAATVEMLVENLQRVDISPFDEGRGYRRLVDEYGYSQADLARNVGKASGHITKRLALITLDSRVEQFLGEGTVTLESLYELSQLPEKKQQSIVKKLVENKAVHQFAYSVDQAAADVKAKAAEAAFTAKLEKAMIETVAEFPKDKDKQDYVHMGRFDKSSLASYTPKKNHIVVRGPSYDRQSINVWRPKTKADLAKIEKQREADEARRAEYAEQRKANATPHDEWVWAVRALEDTYRTQLDEYRTAVTNMTGDYLKELAPKDAGKIALSMVASLAYENARNSAIRLAIPPITTGPNGEELSEWNYDYETPLREWVDGDVSRLVKAWIAGTVKLDHVASLNEFGTFRGLLEEQGIAVPQRPELPPEPWQQDDGTWSTEPHPEGEDGADDTLDYIEEDVEAEFDEASGF